MAGEIPFFIEGKVVEILPGFPVATVKVVNGNIYNIHNDTPGIRFEDVKLNQIIRLEVTTRLNRVLSARIVGDTNDT